MWPDSPLFRGIQQRIIPQPKSGPTMDAWKARIPQDLEELNAPRKYKLPSQMSRDELVDMASDLAMPMAGTIEKSASGAVRKLFHGSPKADLESFDRLAPRELKSKPDRMDSFGAWFAESPEEAKMFTRGFDAEGKPMVGKIYETDVNLSNPKEYGSFDELLDDFNRAAGREAWVGKTRAPDSHPFTARGVAPDGGNLLNAYLRRLGFDGAKVSEANGIDRPGSPQTYWVSLDPEVQARIIRLLDP